jgi:CubicO group peptidase (beta-lactamase class C family)
LKARTLNVFPVNILKSCATLALISTMPAFAQERPTIRVDFNAHRITKISVRGLADPGSNRAVTIDDPVRIASISKMFVAFGVLRLVDQRKIDLDADVSRYLGWPLRNPWFPDKAITLRLLLSHQSSVSDAADYLIPVDQTIRAKMADPKAWDTIPTSTFRLSPASWRPRRANGLIGLSSI